MGGEASRPSVANCISPTVLHEIKKCTLGKLREAMEYWQRELYSRKNMTLHHLDDVLGHLVSDSEIHFQIFSGSEKHVNSVEVFSVFAILASDSVEAKVKYLFNWFGKESARVKKDVIKSVLINLLNGVSKLFRTPVPTDMVLDALISSYFTESSIQKFDKAEDLVEISGGGGASNLLIPFGVIWEWCQDNKDVSEFLENISNVGIASKSAKNKIMSIDTSKALVDSKIAFIEKSMNPALSFKTRNVLWRVKLKDLFQDSWLDALPVIDESLNVFSALELMSLRNTRAIAVMKQQEIPINIADSGSGGNSPKAKKRTRTVLSGVLDYITLATWLVDCCPDSILTDIDAKTLIRSRVAHKNIDINVNAGIDFGTLLQSIGTLGNRDRRQSTTQSHNIWQDVGEKFATTSLQEVMAYVADFERTQGIFVDRDDFATLNVDEYIYSAMLQFSKGYRTLPLRIGETSKNKIVHLLSDVEMAYFIWENSDIMLGDFRKTEVGQCGLMKVPIAIPADTNLACAFKITSMKKVETAVILDEQNKIGSLFDTSCLSDIWWSWKLQSGIDPTLTLTQVQTMLSAGQISESHPLFSEYSRNFAVYTVFNALITPLKFCEMVHYKPFEVTVGVHVDDETSDSSGSDSDSSNCNSSSSDNSNSPKKMRNSRIQKSLTPAAPSPRTKAITARSNLQGSKNEQRENKVGAQSNPKRKFVPKAPSGAPGRVSSRAASVAHKKISLRKKVIAQDTSEFNAAREAERSALERKHRIHANFKSKGAVYVQDTIQAALEAMTRVGRTRAFVVSDTGDVLGVITLKDIAKYLVQKEVEEKLALRREDEIDGGEFVIIGDTLGTEKGSLLASGVF